MSREVRYHALSILSGCAWGGIAYLLGRGAMGPVILGGVLASPLIGLLVGWALRRVNVRSKGGLVFLSLVSLYSAAALFGVATGVYDWLTGAERRIPLELVFESVIGIWWGLTFMGYVVVLWPLAYLNHWLLLGQAADLEERKAW